jgi:hypothetical protein
MRILFVVYVEEIISVLFGGVAAKKNIFRCAKLNGVGGFAPAGAT